MGQKIVSQNVVHAIKEVGYIPNDVDVALTCLDAWSWIEENTSIRICILCLNDINNHETFGYQIRSFKKVLSTSRSDHSKPEDAVNSALEYIADTSLLMSNDVSINDKRISKK